MIPLADLLDAADFSGAVENLARKFRERFALPPVHQLGVVVPDAEAAAAALEARGIGPFFLAAGKPAFWRERGQERAFAGKLGLAYHHGFEIELLEPGQGSDFYRQSLDPQGRPVVQHLGLLAPDVDAAAGALVQAGYPVWVRGRIATGPMKTEFAYLDTVAETGLIIEFISWKFFGLAVEPPPGLVHFLGRLEKWSGKRSISV